MKILYYFWLVLHFDYSHSRHMIIIHSTSFDNLHVFGLWKETVNCYVIIM